MHGYQSLTLRPVTDFIHSDVTVFGLKLLKKSWSWKLVREKSGETHFLHFCNSDFIPHRFYLNLSTLLFLYLIIIITTALLLYILKHEPYTVAISLGYRSDVVTVFAVIMPTSGFFCGRSAWAVFSWFLYV